MYTSEGQVTRLINSGKMINLNERIASGKSVQAMRQNAFIFTPIHKGLLMGLYDSTKHFSRCNSAGGWSISLAGYGRPAHTLINCMFNVQCTAAPATVIRMGPAADVVWTAVID